MSLQAKRSNIIQSTSIMKNKSIILVAIIVASLVSCKPSRDKSTLKIQEMEKSMYNVPVMSFNKSKADSLLKMYDNFVSRFPGDSMAPAYLFRAANLTISTGDGNKALSLLDQFVTNYPSHPKVPVCMFFKGYVYENILKNLDKAKESYLIYIEKYPGDVFVKDARIAIENLGKSPDQIVKEFEQKQKQDSTRKADSITSLNKSKKKRG